LAILNVFFRNLVVTLSASEKLILRDSVITSEGYCV
jgi:hypothetical protein